MVGLATFLVRFGGDAATLFKAAFSKEKINVPTAPSAGLLLDRVLYTHYNEKTPHLKALDFADSEVGKGHKTLVGRQWTLDNKLVDTSRWTPDSGQWTVDSRH